MVTAAAPKLESLDPDEVLQGLYWHCRDNVDRPTAEYFVVLCQLGYSPAPDETGPRTDGARAVHMALGRREFSMDDVMDYLESEDD